MERADRRRRILFVDEDPGRTGSTVSLEYLLRGFRTAGYEVFVLTLKKEPAFLARLAESAEVIGIRSWRMSSIGMNLYFTNTLSCFSRRGIIVMMKETVKLFIVLGIVFRTMRRTGASLVYANEYVLVSAYLASFLRRVPCVVHIRSPFVRGTFGIRRALIAWIVPLFNRAVFAISPVEAGQIRPREKDRGKVYVIGEFVSAASGSDPVRSRQEFGIPDGKRVVTMLGGIVDIKGTIDFLRAAELVARQSGDVYFVIAGRIFRDETPVTRRYYDSCMQIADRLVRRGLLAIQGEITGALRLIDASDIIVSPSPQTHFSRPVIEAWAARKAVIAARTPHMRALISDGVNGILVDPGDARALGDQILRLVNDPLERSRLGEEGRKTAGENFDERRNLSAIVGICDRIVGWDRMP